MLVTAFISALKLTIAETLKPALTGACVAVPLLMLGLVNARAQEDSPYLYQPAPPSYSTPSPVENGYVEQTNGHLHLEFPMGEELPQRGGKTSQYKLIYDSNTWGPNFLYDQSYMSPSFHGGWSTTPVTPGIVGGHLYVDTSFQDADGNIHNFPTYFGSGNAYASDSSGYYILPNVDYNGVVGAQIYAPDGSLVYQGNGNFTYWNSQYGGPSASLDPNGNYQISCTSQVQPGNYLEDSNCDTLGRLSYQSQYGSIPGDSNPYDGEYTYSVPNAKGGSAQYQVAFVSITVSSNFQLPGWQDCHGCSMDVVKSIVLPDGSSYSFMYDCDPNSSTHPEVCYSPDAQYYGEVTKMTLPSGGTIDYQYQLFHDVYGAPSRWVARRDSAATGSSTYTPAVITQCTAGHVGCQQSLTVTNAAGVSTTTTFMIDNGSWPVQIQTAQGSNVLSTTAIQYDMTNACVESGCVGHDYIRKTMEVTTLGITDGYLKTETKYQYDSKEDGLLTAISKWGYALTPYNPDQVEYPTQTFTQYYSPASSPSPGVSPPMGGTNIHRPSQVTICSGTGSDPDCPGGGTKLKQTRYTYDEAAPTSRTGIVNHLDANYGTGLTVRGNATTVQEWIQGSQFATKHYSYDTTGQITSMTDPAGHTTTYGYADHFFNDVDAISSTPYSTPAPTNAYPTTITSPSVNGVQLTTSLGYYFGDGKLASTTDPNNAQSFYHYDGSGRTIGVETPSAWSEFVYTSPTQVDAFTSVGDTSVSTACTSCQHRQLVFDSFGRPLSTLLVNAPGGTIGVDTNYDAYGRVASVSHSYGPLNPTKVYETYSYDIENRVTQVQHQDGDVVQTSYGTNAGSNPEMGPNGPGFHERTVDEAGKGIDSWLDASGNLLEVDEPYVSSGNTYSASVGLNTSTIQSIRIDPCAPNEPDEMPCWETIYDHGNIDVVINGHYFSAGYAHIFIPERMFEQLANQINSSNIGVNAGYSTSLGELIVNSASNFTISGSSYSQDPSDFPTPSISPIVSGPTASSNGGSSGVTVGTFYFYDGLNRLFQSMQDSQLRTFTYDGLSRLIDTTNPEISDNSVPAQKCHVTYTYDGNSNLISRTRPAPNQTSCNTTVTTSYGTYDAWNRSPGTSYSDGEPAVTFTYDQGGAAAHALGRLTKMTDSTGTESYFYDAAGRMNSVQKAVGGKTYTTSYVFNTIDQPTQITYPSGRVVTPSYDNIGRLDQVTSNGTNYLSISPTAGFNAEGKVLQETFGNGVTGQFTYSNDRSQLTSLSYSKSGGTLLALNYGYKLADCPSNTNGMTAADDGMIQCIQDATGTQQAGRSASYSYDALNRLQTTITTGSSTYPQWGLSWEYDRFGNRLAQAVTAGTGYAPLTPVDPLTNRLTGYVYDAPGNLQNFGGTSSFDGENRLIGLAGADTYSYDGNGDRVIKNAGGTQTVYVSSGGQTLDEYDNGAAVTLPTREYIYVGSQKIAAIAQTGTNYYLPDHLSTRLTTDSSGNVVGEQGHTPFGELWYQTGTANKFIFTGQERDSESGLDYFQARHYTSSMGRFMSPDPSGLSYADPTNPQSLNLYAYVVNNPLGNIDPTGLDCVSDNGDGTATINSGDCPGENPNSEYYYDCGSAGDGCLIGTTSAYMTSNDHLALYNGSTNTLATLHYGGSVSGGEQDIDAAVLNSSVPDTPLNPYAQAVFQQVAQQTAWFPDVCSGGGFGYVGANIPLGKAHGFVGYIRNYDSRGGWTNGGLVEGSGHSAGAAGAYSPKGGPEGFVFIPFAEAGGGLVDISKEGVAVGGYVGTPETFPVGVGAGGYFNISTMGACAHR